MPHEVIMPALGVAQDTGLIIAWLKQSGDAIKAGDALMEIETDKAVVEVEAQADGFLSNVSAAAGDQVPVGQVIGLITESLDDVDTVEKETVEAEEQAPTEVIGTNDSIPPGKDIIMPALGMTQDTGLIVAWHKEPGDSVIATDILLEVETDKSVVEVEAGHDGYVAAILAAVQQEVPVGTTIAIISSTRPDKPLTPQSDIGVAPASSDLSEHKNTSQTSSKTLVSRNKAPRANVGEPGHLLNGRILVSPKARRIAIEQGLDLELLVKHGIQQPFHVKDLETLKSLPDTTPTVNTAPSRTVPAEFIPTLLHVEVRVPKQANLDFIDWMKEVNMLSVPARMIWLRYATAALRQASANVSDPLIVEVRKVRSSDGCFANADLARLSKPVMDILDQTPSLVLRDFSSSSITSVTTAANSAPVLTIRQEHSEYVISLDYQSHHLDEDVAIAFVTDFSLRLTEPLRQLL